MQEFEESLGGSLVHGGQFGGVDFVELALGYRVALEEDVGG